MIDYGRRGREAVVDPEITRYEVDSRVACGKYKNISFIHEIAGHTVADVTEEIPSEALLTKVIVPETDLQASSFNRARDLREREASMRLLSEPRPFQISSGLRPEAP
jgi:hypothetical protein